MAMKLKLAWVVLLLGVCSEEGHAQYSAISGNCELPGQAVVVSGLSQSGSQPLSGSPFTTGSGVMAAYPQCQVTVYPAGSNTPEPTGSVYSNSTGTVLGNPFIANTDGSWLFYVNTGCYDVGLSSGTIPSSQLPNIKTLSGKCAGVPGSTNTPTFEVNGTPIASQSPTVNFENGTNVTVSNPSGGNIQFASTGSGGGNPLLENCISDQTGNSFYSAIAFTNWFSGNWQFIPNTTTYFNCEVYIPAGQTGATIVLDVFDSDATAGHTANLQTCDTVLNTGSLNVGSLTCATAQTFTTTTTAYSRSTLTFSVQSTLSNGSLLVVKVGVAPTGTQPTGNIVILPHFVL
jgi:hypothetical protein